MKQSLKQKSVGASLLLLAASLWLGTSGNSFGADDVKKQLLDLTGGRRVKVAWNQGTEQDMKLKFLDTKDGSVRELPFAGSAPLLTVDGRYVLASTGKTADERKLMAYDTETKKVVELATGPCNSLLSIWTDPKTKKIWIYVNDAGDRQQSWDAPWGPIYRFPGDNAKARELFWDRTSSHIYLMFSADGTRACFEPSWANIGQLKLAFDAKGKVDQEKSIYKQFGGGCFPSMAPDNSYRLFRLDGDHRSITMCDAENANQRKIVTTGMLTGAKKGGQTWLTRWSTHPRYLTCMAPDGNDAQIWLGRFDDRCTKIEAWAAVSVDGPKCWQSHAWVEPSGR